MADREVPSERGAVPPKPLSRLRLGAYAVAFVLLGQQLAWRAGDLAIVVAQKGGPRELAAPAATLAAFFLFILLATFFWSRRSPGRRETRRLLAAGAATLVLGYVVLQALVSLFLPVASFHGFYTWRLRSTEERSPTRPRVTYHRGSLGFREPEWGPRQPGVTRVALIGDSYVFGSGVDAGDTLDRALAATLQEIAPDRRFEVLNLGVPGDNIAGHTRLYAIAAEHLDAGAVV